MAIQLKPLPAYTGYARYDEDNNCLIAQSRKGIHDQEVELMSGMIVRMLYRVRHITNTTKTLGTLTIYPNPEDTAEYPTVCKWVDTEVKAESHQPYIHFSKN